VNGLDSVLTLYWGATGVFVLLSTMYINEKIAKEE
jgi:membrane protein insertase Oxa1/YidC/SpoIIIJ